MSSRVNVKNDIVANVMTCSEVVSNVGKVFVATLYASQTADIAPLDHLKFDTVIEDPYDGLVSLDVSSAYTSALGQPSIGRLTLSGGKKYLVSWSGDMIAFNLSPGAFRFESAIRNADTGDYVSPSKLLYQDIRQPILIFSDNRCQCVLEPSSNARYELTIVSTDGLQSVQSGELRVQIL